MNEFKIESDRIFLPGPDGDIAYGAFDEKDDVIVLNTVFVDEEYRGTGQKLGERVMEEVINYARSKNKKIEPVCSYAKHYQEKFNIEDVFVE